MKDKRFWLVLAILALLVSAYGVASADNPLTYDVYVVGQYTCIDFGEWGQCLCPCDATDCDTTLAVSDQPPGIGGGPAVDDWITVTITPTLTSEPIPTNHPKGEPTNMPPPTSVIPTREQPPIWSTPTPITVTSMPDPTATDVPTSVPPTATARPTLVPTVPPTVRPTDTPWDGGCVCHKKESAPGAVTGITKCFASNQESAYNSHIDHGDSEGSCP